MDFPIAPKSYWLDFLQEFFLLWFKMRIHNIKYKWKLVIVNNIPQEVSANKNTYNLIWVIPLSYNCEDIKNI
jgi:hypothetical protein